MLAPHRVRAAGLFLVALWLRFSWMGEGGARHVGLDPSSLRSVRQVFDGHERLYFQAFLGALPDPTPQAWPAGLWLCRLLGMLSSDPRLLLGLAAVSGAAGVVVLERLVRARCGPRASLWAGVLAAALPAHVVWSTSAVPVALAATLMLAGLGSRRTVVAAVCMGGAAALRPELAVLGLLRGGVGAVPLAVGLGTLAWAGAPPGSGVAMALLGNALMVDFLAPASVVLAAVLGGARRPWAVVVVSILVFGCFADLGPRHLLVAGLVLCGLAGRAIARWSPWLGLVVLAGMGGELLELRRVWLRPLAEPRAVLAPGLIGAELPAGCVEVSDEPPIPGQPLPSHLEVVADCRVWGMAPEHTAWSSRGLRARARRMRRRYGGEPVAAEVPGQGRPWRVWIRLGPGRPW